jgi:uncharacterized protein (TIGR02145 family)
VPSDAEWTTLENYLGGSAIAGGALKESGTSHWGYPNTGATNSSGFIGLPGGLHNYNGPCSNIGNKSYWWTSTAYNASAAYFRLIYHNYADVYASSVSKASGFSVRLVKDN